MVEDILGVEIERSRLDEQDKELAVAKIKVFATGRRTGRSREIVREDSLNELRKRRSRKKKGRKKVEMTKLTAI